MRVLMFGWEFPPYNSGGLGVACAGLAHALVDCGIEVVFVLPHSLPIYSDKLKIVFADRGDYYTKNESSDLKLEPTIPFSAYSTTRRVIINNVEYIIPSIHSELAERVAQYTRVAKRISSMYPSDIIHAHDWLAFAAGMEASQLRNTPFVTHIHSTEFDRGGGGGVNTDVYKVEQDGMKTAQAVVAVSGLTRDIAIERYGIDAQKVHIVYNAINTDEYRHIGKEDLALKKKSGMQIVLFVGRMTLQKGPDYFLRAAKIALKYRPNTLFVMAGSGDMEHQIMREAGHLGIANNVLFAGFLRGEELSQMYRSADVFVMPSVSEPFGITALESLAHGTPILVSKQSGVSELITNCLKVDFWDIDEMANKIVAVLEYQSLQAALKDNGEREVQKYSWRDAALQCARIYERIAQTRAAPAFAIV